MSDRIDPPRHILGIEASTSASSVALARGDGHPAGLLRRDGAGPVSRCLLGDLDRLLAGEGITQRQLAAIGVTLGPGTFTGLRVGLALAKTLAHGLGLPLYGYSSLALAAARQPAWCPAVAVLLDARRGEVYSGLFRPRGPGQPPEELREERVEGIDSFLDSLPASLDELWLSGTGARVYRAQIEERLAGRAPRWVPPASDGPGADAVAAAAAADLRAGREGLDPLAAAPRYLRLSDAEKRHRITADLEWSAR